MILQCLIVEYSMVVCSFLCAHVLEYVFFFEKISDSSSFDDMGLTQIVIQSVTTKYKWSPFYMHESWVLCMIACRTCGTCI